MVRQTAERGGRPNVRAIDQPFTLHALACMKTFIATAITFWFLLLLLFCTDFQSNPFDLFFREKLYGNTWWLCSYRSWAYVKRTSLWVFHWNVQQNSDGFGIRLSICQHTHGYDLFDMARRIEERSVTQYTIFITLCRVLLGICTMFLLFFRRPSYHYFTP